MEKKFSVVSVAIELVIALLLINLAAKLALSITKVEEN